jgi:LysM repeat protein
MSESACPYIGLLHDPQTRALTPDPRHACARTSPPRRLPLSQQHNLCLTAGYVNCPGYQQTLARGGKPAAALPRADRRAGLRAWALAALILLALAAAWMAVGRHWLRPGGFAPPPPAPALTDAPTLTPSPEQTLPASSPTSTPVPSRTPTPSPTPRPTQSGTPTPGPLAETPFGPNGAFIVHVVQAGESLEYLARQYGSTVEVLKALNGMESITLWAGWVMVICPGLKENGHLPALRAVWLETGEEVSALAARLKASEAELREWNGLTGERVEGGRWVVVRGE